jgi:subtilisin family serine protease
VQRAVDSAHKHGVTLLVAAGNQGLDLGRPGTDTTSPDYPLGSERTRQVDDSCLSMPAEATHALAVTATGPSGRKAAYSSYGVQRAVVAAPGGDALDGALPWPQRMVLAAYPRDVLARERLIRSDGTPVDPTVVRDCQGTRCAWYRWLEGTSMAVPHAVGVAALLVSRHGGTDARHREGLTLRPTTVERLLRSAAVDRACPAGGVQRYEDGSSARCEGTAARNGFYGDGQVDALRAVS